MKNIVVQLEHVSLNYNREREVFRDVNVSLEEGSFYFLTGPSGSGKTSFLKLIYMGIAPSYGSVRVFGTSLGEISPRNIPCLRQSIGIVFQDCFMLNHLSVVENVALPLRFRGVKEDQANQNAIELLNWVGLGSHLNCYPDVLSGGQQQRAAIARAVINRPTLILADEPTGNVDQENSERIFHLFEELNNRGTTVILATHDRSLANMHAYPELVIYDHSIRRVEHAKKFRSFEDEVRQRTASHPHPMRTAPKIGEVFL